MVGLLVMMVFALIPFLVVAFLRYNKKKGQIKDRTEEYVESVDGNIYRASFHVTKGKVNFKRLINPDPFLKIKMGKNEKVTKTQQNTLEPKWDEDISFEDVSEGAVKNVLLTIWDGDGDLIGTARLNLTQHLNKKTHLSLPLYIGKDIEEAKVELDLELALTGGQAFEKAKEEAATARAKAEVLKRKLAGPKKDVVITVVGGKVYRSHSLVGKDNALVKVVIGDVTKQTGVVKDNMEPTWNENLYFEAVSEEDVVSADVWVCNHRFGKADEPIGTGEVPSLLQYLNNKTHVSLPLLDKGGKEEATVELDVVMLEVGGATALKTAEEKLKREAAVAEKAARDKAKAEAAAAEKAAKDQAKAEAAAAEKAKAEERKRKLAGPKKDVVITVVSGKIYHSHNVIGKDDAYVKVVIGEVTKQTGVIQSSMEPTWNETLYFEGVPEEDIACADVWAYDHDFGKADDVIGCAAKMSLLPYVDSKAHVTLCLVDRGQREAEVEADIVVLDAGKGTALKLAEENAKREKAAAEKAEREKARAEAAAAEKAAKEQAKAEAAAAAKAKAEERRRKLDGPKKDVVITVLQEKV